MNKYSPKTILSSYKFLFFIAFSILVIDLTAQNNKEEVKLSLSSVVNQTNLTIGKKIYLTVTLDQFLISDRVAETNLSTSSFEVFPLPILDQTIGDFEILNYEIVNNGIEKISSHHYRQAIIYTITIYQTGNFTLPAISYRFKDKTVQSKSISIQITSLIDTNSIHNILSEKENLLAETIVGKLNSSIVVVFSGILLLLILVILFYYFKIRKPVPPIPFYEITLIELASLKNQYKNKLFQTDKVKKTNKWFCYQLYQIMKKYISDKEGEKSKESKKGALILSMTTYQFKRYFTQHSVEHYDFYINFFTYADSIKFNQIASSRINQISYKEKNQSFLNEFIKQVENYRTKKIAEIQSSKNKLKPSKSQK